MPHVNRHRAIRHAVFNMTVTNKIKSNVYAVGMLKITGHAQSSALSEIKITLISGEEEMRLST